MKSFRTIVQESAVGAKGRTGKADAIAHIEGSALEKEFQKIVKKLGGKTVARELLQRMNSVPTVAVALGEAKLDKNDPIIKRYNELKKLSIKEIQSIFNKYNRVGNTKGVPKLDLVTDILYSEFRAKEVQKAFKLSEAKQTPSAFLRDSGYKIKSENPTKNGTELEFYKDKDAEYALQELTDAGFVKDYSLNLAHKHLEIIAL